MSANPDRMSLEEFNKLQGEGGKGRNRYKNRKKEDKPTEDGFIFDSNPELYRYRDLKTLARTGEIRDLKVHPKFRLKEKSVNDHGQKAPKWTFTSDFSYYCANDIFCVEDVKSLRIDKKNKYGTATERGYILSRNEFMRQHPSTKFIETVY